MISMREILATIIMVFAIGLIAFFPVFLGANHRQKIEERRHELQMKQLELQILQYKTQNGE